MSLKTNRPSIAFTFAACLWLMISMSPAESLPPEDRRAENPPRTLDTLRAFPEIQSKTAWRARAKEIREQVLVSCGLWPLPEKTPLQARIFGKMEREGYSIEKVHLQTYPGFYLAGNLYRPLGKGPFPGILNPHGHWKEGRFADTELGSIAARCINFARQGMVAFSYDMVGYNDTRQVNHKFASNPTNLLWNISLMGLQTWNSVRALDFLESLPDVDKSRLACTGESGGGTQTFMLGAVDDRLAAQAPIVMVSHSMQGGCLCENAPGLRVDYSNMEIAAVPAPRPQILVAASGDWTKKTMEIEGPSIQRMYRLFQAEDKFRFVLFDFDHNYNQTSREAVYEWFGQCLLNRPEPSTLKEVPYQKEPDDALRVWPDGKLPSDALTETQLIQSLIQRATGQLQSIKPTDNRSFENYKEMMLPAWRHTLQVEFPEKGLVVEAGAVKKVAADSLTTLHLGRAGKGDRIPALLVTPEKDSYRYMAVLAHPEGKSAYLDTSGAPKGLAQLFLKRNYAVLLLDTFLTGEVRNEAASQARKPFTSFFPTYNRTDLQERVQDLITACAFAKTHAKGRHVILCGAGRAGLWTLLAAPAADVSVADCDQLDLSNDTALMEPSLYAPGLRRMGVFTGAASLAAPNPILVHNTGRNFSTEWLSDTYAALKAKDYRRESERLGDEALVDWVANLRNR